MFKFQAIGMLMRELGSVILADGTKIWEDAEEICTKDGRLIELMLQGRLPNAIY